MADRGNISGYIPQLKLWGSKIPSAFSRRSNGIVITINGANPNATIALFNTKGINIDSNIRANSNGVFNYYDLADGTYMFVETFEGTFGSSWKVVISGNVVTVTKITTFGIPSSFSFG